MKKLTCLVVLCVTLFSLSTFVFAEGGGRYQSASAWSFGVHGDTQWTIEEDALNPDYIAGSILTQVNNEFIKRGVKFVIAMGDMTDRAKPGAMATRAGYAKPLYDKGIGFFPMRGNHETYGWLYNYSPVEAEIKEMLDNFPQTQMEMFGAYNISSPTTLDGKENKALKGLSYSFDYGPEGSNARMVIVDTSDVTCETTEVSRNGVINPYWPKACHNYPIPSQQEWVSNRLNKGSRNTTHAFVLSHYPPIAQNHIDSPFNPSTIFGETSYYLNNNLEAQNTFFESMDKNDVKYYLGAHDHIHQRSIINSPDSSARLQEIIAAGLSTKFYNPSPIPFPQISMDGETIIEDQWFGQKGREISLSQEENNIGYYVYMVDGPRISVDYYADSRGNFQSNNNYPFGVNIPDYPKGVTPELKFIKKESFGYSLNGREFLVAQGDSYTVIQDRFENTSVKVLDGANKSTAVDANTRKFTKAIETGWVKNPDPDKLKSDIFSLWGMSDLGANGKTDTYVLAISVDPKKTTPNSDSMIYISTFVGGKWINAVNENFGGNKKYIQGKYKPEYQLGAFGYDIKTKTAWAVLNYNADFAVATK